MSALVSKILQQQTTAPAAAGTVMPAQEPLKEDFYKEGLQGATIQRKLSIGAVDDPLEAEADAMADKVMRMPERPFVQRKCARCEEEETIQRSPLAASITPFIQAKGGDGGTASDTVTQQVNATRGNGSNMDRPTQSFMESRFGTGFSNVKIHTGDYAVQMSRELNAQAFTVGSDIYFNSGKYNPLSESGKHLLAHELTHTVQQGAATQIQKTGEEGSALIQDTVRSASRTVGTNQWSGTVDREQYIPASGSTPRRVIQFISGVRIQFDGDSCTVRLPTRVQFVHPSATNWPFAPADAGSPVPTPLAQSVFDDIKNRYIRLANQWMNNWFRVELSNCAGNTACRNISIEASITEVTSSPTTTVIIANKRGRSFANANRVVIHANTNDGSAITDDRLIHEGGHTVLGYLDEYPGAARREAVHRDDFSMAGDHTVFNTWMLAQERHFSFVPAFLQNIFPGCTARLVALERPTEVLFTPSLVVGGTSYGGGALHAGIGFDLGIPFDIQRRLQFMLGLRAHSFIGLSVASRLALMGGIRAGLSYTTNLSSGGLHIGAFGELGGGTFDGEERSGVPGRPVTGRFGAAYGAAGGTIGYTLPFSGRSLTISAEGSYGGAFGLSAADLMRFGPQQWYNLGLSIAVRFR
jgi:Domain of unknown function (DUF4157)